ncbi:hypothetical protein WICMUC_002262 [Wickerhamomyces mucosus]|uniref:Uncharacterized protein n=1 Tax=Wickerhamomyces mucosus TaxID=1378264 RepID=A0A9P8TF11_9ASCO|nr:hypothetical protein WICMUC_002262 [Wickerhamomyces mucosus]
MTQERRFSTSALPKPYFEINYDELIHHNKPINARLYLYHPKLNIGPPGNRLNNTVPHSQEYHDQQIARSISMPDIKYPHNIIISQSNITHDKNHINDSLQQPNNNMNHGQYISYQPYNNNNTNIINQYNNNYTHQMSHNSQFQTEGYNSSINSRSNSVSYKDSVISLNTDIEHDSILSNNNNNNNNNGYNIFNSETEESDLESSNILKRHHYRGGSIAIKFDNPKVVDQEIDIDSTN